MAAAVCSTIARRSADGVWVGVRVAVGLAVALALAVAVLVKACVGEAVRVLVGLGAWASCVLEGSVGAAASRVALGGGSVLVGSAVVGASA